MHKNPALSGYYFLKNIQMHKSNIKVFFYSCKNKYQRIVCFAKTEFTDVLPAHSQISSWSLLCNKMPPTATEEDKDAETRLCCFVFPSMVLLEPNVEDPPEQKGIRSLLPRSLATNRSV